MKLEFAMKSTIRLFSAVPIRESSTKQASQAILEATIRRGFVFSPEVVYNYSEEQLRDLVQLIETEIGLTPEQMNNTFQKSWAKVRDASIYQLVIEQIIHYFTTYGFKALGIYDEHSVYVPHGDLDIPELTEDVKIVVIKGYTKEELQEKILDLLESGVALGEDTQKDIIDVATFVKLPEEKIHDIKNREVKIALYDAFGIVPEEPIEFLRYVLFKTTTSPLLIKNKETFTLIQEHASLGVDIFKIYQKNHGLERLAEIFYRFKPLFLAFRSDKTLRPIINKIRRLAVKHHRPLWTDFLNEVTAMLRHGQEIDIARLQRELGKVNIFRKIRLAQALRFRMNKDSTSIIYKVRNGKAYATEFSFENRANIGDILSIVIKSIIADIRKNVEGKKIYIPDNVTYALPATEKQFTGNLPSGTSVKVGNDMIFGVHWENIDSSQIDLDLSLISKDGLKIGWDGSYRDSERTILFSGDLTDAPPPQGASELIYINRGTDDMLTPYILFVNYYNFNASRPVPFKILVASESVTSLEMNHMVDPNTIECITTSKMDRRQKMLGLIVTGSDGCTFYFNESNLGASITSASRPFSQHARQYLFDYSPNMLTLNEVLSQSGAIMIDTREDADIDLSPESLEKDTILSLLS